MMRCFENPPLSLDPTPLLCPSDLAGKIFQGEKEEMHIQLDILRSQTIKFIILYFLESNSNKKVKVLFFSIKFINNFITLLRSTWRKNTEIKMHENTQNTFILENQKDNHFITFKTLLPTQCFLLYAIFRATGGFLVKHLGIFS